MTPDELRALADALDRLKFRCDGIDDACLVEDAADYLRACANAQPVAWRKYDGEENYNYRDYELNEDYADEWNRRNPKHVGWVEPLYTHPAPAAPQAMEDANVWKQIVPDDEPQAGPKREPNPDEVICPACTHQFRAIPENVQVQLWALDDVQIGTLSTQGLFASMHPMDVAEAVRLVERAHGIGGSDAE